MHFAMKNGQICFSLRKFLAISSAIQKIASDCGCDAVVHLAKVWTRYLRGEFWSSPLRVGSPWATVPRLLRDVEEYIVGFLRLLGWFYIRYVVMPSCSATHICGHVCFKGPAKSWTSFLGFVQFVWHVVQVLRRWGRLPWWGGLRTPRYHGPLG